MKRFILALIILLMPTLAWGATWYVRPVTGEYGAENGQAWDTAFDGFGDIVWGAGGVVAGDTLCVGQDGDTFAEQLTVGAEGSTGQLITIDGDCDANETDTTIDLSADAASAYGILVVDKSYLAVKNLQVKGSGGHGAITITGDSGAEGYTVTLTDINILSNYGASAGDSDCFSFDNTAQVNIINSTATKCRTDPVNSGSHQAFALHGSSKVLVTGGTISDCNFFSANVGSPELYITGITASGNITGGWDNSSGATNSSIIIVDQSTITYDSSGDFPGNMANGNAGHITIKNSTINATTANTDIRGYPYGGTYTLQNNTITLNSAGVGTIVMAGCEMIWDGNTVDVTDVRGILVDVQQTGKITAFNNTFTAAASFNERLFKSSGTAETFTINTYYNIFKEFDGGTEIWWFTDDGGYGKIYNNVVYNSSLGGKAIDNDFDNDETAPHLVKNNIFYNVANVCAGDNKITYSNNDYYNSNNEGGTGSITSDPLFVSAGTDFRLQSTSPCINAGTDVGLLTDYLGYSIVGLPDIGAYESGRGCAVGMGAGSGSAIGLGVGSGGSID